LNPEELLQMVAADVAVCEKCELHFSRKRAVAGEGPVGAEIMFIGEGPGFHENEQGRPFVGAAGKYLEELLSSIGLKRSDVFITNVVKCRPPGNRDPRPEEVETCTSNYLDRQVMAINPKVIVTLGRYSMERYLQRVRISEVHGQAFQVRGRLVVPMYHPAAALHQGSLRSVIERDFARLPELISRATDAPAFVDGDTTKKEDPKQLSLF
jgi:uracil-DNA glycosylase